MKKISVIFLLLFIIFFAFCLHTYAANIDSRIETPENNSAIDRDNELTRDENRPITPNNPNNPNTQTQAPPPTPPRDFFTAENILSIFLITIGVVLVFLSIAIFIRVK